MQQRPTSYGDQILLVFILHVVAFALNEVWSSLSVNSKMLRPMATTNCTVNDLQALAGCIQSKFLKLNHENLLIVSRLVPT